MKIVLAVDTVQIGACAVDTLGQKLAENIRAAALYGRKEGTVINETTHQVMITWKVEQSE